MKRCGPSHDRSKDLAGFFWKHGPALGSWGLKAGPCPWATGNVARRIDGTFGKASFDLSQAGEGGSAAPPRQGGLLQLELPFSGLAEFTRCDFRLAARWVARFSGRF